MAELSTGPWIVTTGAVPSFTTDPVEMVTFTEAPGTAAAPGAGLCEEIFPAGTVALALSVTSPSSNCAGNKAELAWAE